MSIFSGARVHQIVTPDRLNIRIGKKSERVSRLLREVPRSLGTVDTDRDGPNSLRFDLL